MISFEEAINKNNLLVVTYGGGTNSKAILSELYSKWVNSGNDNKYKPDIIVFADPGGEHPHTYADMVKVNNWLFSVDWPQIDTVKTVNRNGEVIPLYEYCYNRDELPSKAYGSSSCSEKNKTRPVNKFLNNHPLCKKTWGKFRKLTDIKSKVTRIVGIDAGEDHRIQPYLSNTSKAVVDQNLKYDVVFPLVDWDMDREDCVQSILDMGWDLPGKSSCFFCPSMTKPEILKLKEDNPELLEKALDLENNCKSKGNLKAAKGLGRRLAWHTVVQPGFSGEVGDKEPCIMCND